MVHDKNSRVVDRTESLATVKLPCRAPVRWFTFISLFLLAALAWPAQTTIFPDIHWQSASPESQGLNSARLREAVALLDRTVGKDGARELAIVRHGRLIWAGPDADKVHGIWSFTKSFTSTALGLLIDDGKCALDSRAQEFVPELAGHYPNVTLRHFTTMTSGYRALGDEPQGTYYHGPSKTPFLPNPQPLFTPPGSQYAYWDSAMNEFGLVLTRIAGEPLEQLFKRRIGDPIGMNPKQWHWGILATNNGVAVNGGSGNGNRHIFISAREAARFGLLFLNHGNWNGRQVLSARWVEQATRVQVPAATPWAHPVSEIDGRGVYGFNWWVNGVKPDGQRKLPGAPQGTFWASGHNNNKCFVIPEWDMVIVRLGLDGKAPDQVWNDFLAKIGESLNNDTTTENRKITAPTAH
jgi:CubicO group peptidase (beta-lactamase class C family)